MCGRYFIDDEMWREIKKICRQIDDAKLKVTRADVHPTDLAWGVGWNARDSSRKDALGIYFSTSGWFTYQCQSRDSIIQTVFPK